VVIYIFVTLAEAVDALFEQRNELMLYKFWISQIYKGFRETGNDLVFALKLGQQNQSTIR